MSDTKRVALEAALEDAAVTTFEHEAIARWTRGAMLRVEKQLSETDDEKAKRALLLGLRIHAESLGIAHATAATSRHNILVLRHKLREIDHE